MMVPAWPKIEYLYAALACSFVQAPAAGECWRTTIGNMEAWTEIVMLQVEKEYDQIHTQGGRY